MGNGIACAAWCAWLLVLGGRDGAAGAWLFWGPIAAAPLAIWAAARWLPIAPACRAADAEAMAWESSGWGGAKPRGGMRARAAGSARSARPGRGLASPSAALG